MQFALDEVDSSWHPFFQSHLALLNEILGEISSESYTPARENIFRAFRQPLSEVRIVIFGQDPYPGDGVADGLAFSSPSSQTIPASLRNIFKEYAEDLSLPVPISPDLSIWSERGVLLLNRSLTTVVGERNAHLGLRWKSFTEDVAKYLGTRSVVAILWGNYARELAEYFQFSIESAHPSPLSARRGFFGSRPFSTSNSILREIGRLEVDWTL
ncbi:Ung Uracil DNA glycosylase [Candidatus Nanopelagicaceae bacterium]